MIDTKTIMVDDGAGGARLDKYLSERLPELSRSRIQSLIEGGHVSRAGVSIADSAYKVKPGEKYHLIIPEAVASHIIAQDIALDVVFEDEHLLVINKPAGLTVHPAPGHPDMTLVNALLAHCGSSLSGIGGVQRPGIVHRIDKDTSGLLVVAKHDSAHNALSAQLANRTLKRTYAALCWGVPSPASGTIKGNIGRSISNRQKMAVVRSGGKEAVTHYKLVASHQSLVTSLVECNLETGRTHQIRVHMAHVNHPLIGDPTYGQSTASRLKSNPYKQLPEATQQALLAFNRQALHARQIGFIHPATRKKVSFEIDLPEDMLSLIAALQ